VNFRDLERSLDASSAAFVDVYKTHMAGKALA
jgi:hypothetical protein